MKLELGRDWGSKTCHHLVRNGGWPLKHRLSPEQWGIEGSEAR